MTFDKDQAVQAIEQGATIADLAHTFNMGWTEAALQLDSLGIPPPNALAQTAPDRLVAQYMGLVQEGAPRLAHNQLIEQPDGSLLGMPKGFSLQRIDLNAIFERFHGPNGYVDPFTGVSTGRRVLVVNSSEVKAGAPRNFLITNLETISDASIDARYCKWMRPIQESWEFAVNDFVFQIEISRPYDKLVGGTYTQMYVDGLFERWVGGPLQQYAASTPEKEPVFKPMTTFEMAWWAWQQLTHYGLLKGLVRLKVTGFPDNRTTVLRDDDVMNAIIGYALKDQNGSPLIVPANASQMPQKFAPGALLNSR